MKFVLGLTGQTGAGKSSLHNVANDNGFYVIDCDKVARDVQSRNSVLCALIRAFGTDILNKEGLLDRRRLAEKAFVSRDATELLNRTVLPFIVAELRYLIDNTENNFILLDAPTLYESGADAMCNKTVGIIADEAVRIERIQHRDSLTDEEALSRIKAGKPDDFFRNKCDFVLENNDDRQEFINNFDKLLKNILGGNF